MTSINADQVSSVLNAYHGRHGDLVNEVRAVCSKLENPIAIGVERADRLSRTYRIRLEHLSEIGVEVIGGREFLESLRALGAETAGVLGVATDSYSYTMIVSSDLRELIAALRLPVNERQ